MDATSSNTSSNGQAERPGAAPPARGGWFKVDNNFVHAIDEAGPVPSLAYIVLARYADQAGECSVSIGRIAQLLGVGRRTAQRAIGRLIELQLVDVLRRQGDSGISLVNAYRLLPPPPRAQGDGGDALGCQVDRPRVSPEPPQGGLCDAVEGGLCDTVRAVCVTPNKDSSSVKKTLSQKTTPIKTRPKQSFGEEDMGTALWIHQLNQELQPGRKAPNFEEWANTIRLMRERDGRTDEQIRQLYEWCHQDQFWCTNVLSPDKLREKWDDLDLRRKRSGRTVSASPARVHDRQSQWTDETRIPRIDADEPAEVEAGSLSGAEAEHEPSAY